MRFTRAIGMERWVPRAIQFFFCCMLRDPFFLFVIFILLSGSCSKEVLAPRYIKRCSWRIQERGTYSAKLRSSLLVCISLDSKVDFFCSKGSYIYDLPFFCLQGEDHEKIKTSKCGALDGCCNSSASSFNCYWVSPQVPFLYSLVLTSALFESTVSFIWLYIYILQRKFV